jgi:beta-1,2-mannobiose phosphorylase / 1,2-beta-oligomannan phosphorylase
LGLVERHPANPILAPIPRLSWASKKVYNAAVALEHGTYHMLFRAVGEDWISRLGYARSSDGIKFEVESEPVMSPSFSWDAKGCEDPRVTRVDGALHVVYTAWDEGAACLAIAETEDWHAFTHRRLVLPDWRLGYWQRLVTGPRGWSKAGALFPCRLDGHYGMLFGDSDIWYAHSANLRDWTPRLEPVLSAREGHFDAGYVEMGPPPLRTDTGWLLLYHGVERREDEPGRFRVYRLGAALLDLEEPWRVLWRCEAPLLEPLMAYEAVGLIDVMPGAVEELRTLTQSGLEERASTGTLASATFCCGAIEVEGHLSLYYSGSDTVMCLARTTMHDVLRT